MILDRKDFNADLLSNYEDSVNFLVKNLRLKYIIRGTGPRKEILELPEEALREALLNAIIHRDYFDDRYGIFVEIFDDRVEITNKGKLLFDKSKLGTISLPRNPIIFDMFYRMDLIEKVGSGINRIKKFVQERELSVDFEMDDFFRVKFKRVPLNEPLNEPLNGPLNEPLKRLFEYIKKNEKSTKLAIMSDLDLSRATTTRYLSELNKKKMIKRVGSKKTGYYSIEDKV